MKQGREQKAYPKKLLPGTYCPFLPSESQPQHSIYINTATISIVLHKRDEVTLPLKLGNTRTGPQTEKAWWEKEVMETGRFYFLYVTRRIQSWALDFIVPKLIVWNLQ